MFPSCLHLISRRNRTHATTAATCDNRTKKALSVNLPRFYGVKCSLLLSGAKLSRILAYHRRLNTCLRVVACRDDKTIVASPAQPTCTNWCNVWCYSMWPLFNIGTLVAFLAFILLFEGILFTVYSILIFLPFKECSNVATAAGKCFFLLQNTIKYLY